MFFSLIIPVYNRPDEVAELLQSVAELNSQQLQFEVIIVEDGSTVPCEAIVSKYQYKFPVRYFSKPNSGPGQSRNYGAERASGDYLIFLDSDCILPKDYLLAVHKALQQSPSDAFGGPDSAHPSFTPIQKAINYSMTSFFTTGGIRGGGKRLEKFHPRSFNMGFSRQVFEVTNGFSDMRFGEDIDMSLRIFENGFTACLIPAAWVYHKRRTDFKKFFKQVYNSGIARINLFYRHPNSLKIVHLLPSIFVLGSLLLLFLGLFGDAIFFMPLFVWVLAIFFDALFKSQSIVVAALAVTASAVQLFGYGIGFLEAVIKRVVLKQGEFSAFLNNFYK
ncbi:MAG: glycosyltransferase [Schleiferiaceae bacterium]|nr:glycosyltransferase [Schleiferiaceae bacterium]